MKMDALKRQGMRTDLTLKEQYVSGNLTEVTKDKKYAAVLEAVRQKVVK